MPGAAKLDPDHVAVRILVNLAAARLSIADLSQARNQVFEQGGFAAAMRPDDGRSTGKLALKPIRNCFYRFRALADPG